MAGTIDLYQDDYDFGDSDFVENYTDDKQSYKQKARARKMLEERQERKRLRKHLEDFNDYD